MVKLTIRLALFSAFMIPVEIIAWRSDSDVLLNLYISISGALLTTRLFNWPRAEWLGTRRIDTARRRWGSRHIGSTNVVGAKISVFGERLDFRQYFAAIAYKQNSDTLCNEIYASMGFKIPGYAFAALCYAYLDASVQEIHGQLEILVKSGAFVAATLLPLILDYARCEGQKYWNKELQVPPS